MTVILPAGHRPMKAQYDSGAATIQSQKDRRYLDCFHDQHRSKRFPDGRPWSGYREFSSENGYPDGFLQADLYKADFQDPFNSGWDAPWVPEVNGGRQSFYEFDYNRKKIAIRYDNVIQHDKAAMDRYYQAAAKLAGANGWGEIRYGVTPVYQVTSLIGDPPRSPKIAQAAQAGDPWLLGFSDEPNEELARLLNLSRQGFAMPTVEGVISSDAVLHADSGTLNALIAEAVAKALAARDAKDAAKDPKKKLAQAESHAA
jgi:hypothetical protein